MATQSSINTLPDALCFRNIDLSVVSFRLPDVEGARTSHLASAVMETAPSHLPLQAEDAIVYFNEVDAPGLERCVSDVDCLPKALKSREAAALGWHLYSQLPTSAPDQFIALVLNNPPTGYRKLYFDTPDVKYSNSSFELSDRVLFVLTNSDNDTGTEKTPSAGTSASAAAANEILDWLLAGLADRNDMLEAIQREVVTSCLNKSAAAVAKFLKIVQAGADTGGEVTAGVAGVAQAAVEAFTHAEELQKAGVEWDKALMWSRVAWERAVALASHPDLVIKPQFPPEHVLALLLPIGLPIFLAVVQAVGREVRAARRKSQDMLKSE